MYRSAEPQNPVKPPKPNRDDPPDPHARYAPADCIKLMMHDMDGNPVTVVLSPRAAASLAEQLYAALIDCGYKGGAK